jgi:hypothetical protein
LATQSSFGFRSASSFRIMFVTPYTAWVGSPRLELIGGSPWYARNTYPLMSST